MKKPFRNLWKTTTRFIIRTKSEKPFLFRWAFGGFFRICGSFRGFVRKGGFLGRFLRNGGFLGRFLRNGGSLRGLFRNGGFLRGFCRRGSLRGRITGHCGWLRTRYRRWRGTRLLSCWARSRTRGRSEGGKRRWGSRREKRWVGGGIRCRSIGRTGSWNGRRTIRWKCLVGILIGVRVGVDDSLLLRWLSIPTSSAVLLLSARHHGFTASVHVRKGGWRLSWGLPRSAGGGFRLRMLVPVVIELSFLVRTLPQVSLFLFCGTSRGQ